MKVGSMQLRNMIKRKVEAVAPDSSLREAAHKTNDCHATMLPVCVGRKLVGLITLRDWIVRATAQGCDPRTSAVREIMTREVVYGREDQDVHDAVALMQSEHFSHLPVLDGQGHLKGIVSLDDLLENAMA